MLFKFEKSTAALNREYSRRLSVEKELIDIAMESGAEEDPVKFAEAVEGVKSVLRLQDEHIQTLSKRAMRLEQISLDLGALATGLIVATIVNRIKAGKR